MKLSVFIVIFALLCSCTDTMNVSQRKYPGLSRTTDCYVLWDLHYDLDVAKCEAWLNNPKFKIGQRVRVTNTRYDKSCYGLISSAFTWTPKINVGRYGLEISCNGQVIESRHGYDGIVETDLESIK